MRTLTENRLGKLNETLEITVADEPGAGGACHRYDIIGHGEHIPNIGPRPFGVNLFFQKGPATELEQMNGITNEALLVVLIDRLRGFQGGPFGSRENALALTNLEQALMWLQKRTRDRLARGVEGTQTR